MNESKKSLLQALFCVTIAILLIIWGGTVAFTIACLMFAASGALHHKSIVEADLERFTDELAAGVFASEEDGEIPEAVIDLEELSESDKEVVQRLFGIDFATGEDYTDISEVKQGETKDGH